MVTGSQPRRTALCGTALSWVSSAAELLLGGWGRGNLAAPPVLLHPRHLRYLQPCRRCADGLVVPVSNCPVLLRQLLPQTLVIPPQHSSSLHLRSAGGGPAGLSAALILGRARRRVLIFDSGEKRNEASLIQHAILGADGFNRSHFLEGARKQVCVLRVGVFEVGVYHGRETGKRHSTCGGAT